MDTRTKILDRAALERFLERFRRDPASATVVTGWFDPLVAAHARRLEQIAATAVRPLVVLITSPPDELLPAAGRAELVAGLRVVDRVGIADRSHLGALPEGAAIREEEADRERRRGLIQLVRSRR